MPSDTMERRPVISVIIATHNREALLGRTLEALAAQDLARQDFEVVVVDNASSDGTTGLLTHWQGRADLCLRAAREERPGKSYAVNTGVSLARGHLLVFTDDDVVPDPGWLGAFQRAFRETHADFAVGRILPWWDTEPPRWMSRALHGVLAVPDNGSKRLEIRSGLNEAVMPIGANMAMRRDTCERVGLWRPDLGKLRHTLRSGEDHELFLRMLRAGLRGVYEPLARVRHFVPRERLRKAYFRRWLYDNGAIVSDIEREYRPPVPHLLGVPRYLWREAVSDSWRLAKAAVTRDPATRFAREVRLLWFAGYVTRAWTRRRSHRPAPALSLEHR